MHILSLDSLSLTDPTTTEDETLKEVVRNPANQVKDQKSYRYTTDSSSITIKYNLNEDEQGRFLNAQKFTVNFLILYLSICFYFLFRSLKLCELISSQPLKLQEQWTLKSTRKFRRMSWNQLSKRSSQLTRRNKASKSRNTANEINVYQNAKKSLKQQKNYNRIVLQKGNFPHSLELNKFNCNKGSGFNEFKISNQNEASKQCLMNSTKNNINQCNQTQILKIFGFLKEKMNQNKIISYENKSFTAQKSTSRIVFIVSPDFRALDLFLFEKFFTRNGSHALFVSMFLRFRETNYSDSSSKQTLSPFASKLAHAQRKNKTNYYSFYETEIYFDRNPQLIMFNQNVVAISAKNFTIPFTND